MWESIARIEDGEHVVHMLGDGFTCLFFVAVDPTSARRHDIKAEPIDDSPNGERGLCCAVLENRSQGPAAVHAEDVEEFAVVASVGLDDVVG